MQAETWCKIWCEGCNTPNWLCVGNIDDLTKPDLEGFECFGCGKRHEFFDDYPASDEIAYEVGLEKPR